MKKIISKILIITILLPIFTIKAYSTNDDEWYFVVTAYYSPLPNQESYLTGDYESEKRLNGQWISWASWKWVFSWMLAAPRNYAFWTKIYLEWLWIWEVSDRWWAIVNAWKRWYEYDRIDVWVWHWDEWLKRALYWWKRKVKWYVTDSSLNVTFDFNNIASPDWATKWLKKISSIFNTWLWKWSDKEMVKNLQKLFTEIWLYKWEINGIYNDEIISIVYNFQLKNEIVKSSKDYWAWYWGKNTRDIFLKEYLDWDFDNNKYTIKNIENNEEIDNQESLESSIDPEKELKDKSIDLQIVQIDVKKELKDKSIELEITQIDVEKELKNKSIDLQIVQIDVEKELKNENSEIFEKTISTKEDVIKLQNILKELSLYNWEITGIYNDVVDSIYKFQLSKWIVLSTNSPWAWNYWPKTRSSLKDIYNEYLFKIEKERIEKVMLEEEKKLEELRIKQEKIFEEERKKELEEKYRKLEELSLKKAEEKLSNIWIPKFWEISQWVRKLQIILKELGYFQYKDTAIFWDMTKESIFSYQLSKNLVSKKDDLGAWMIGPRTLETIKNDLKNIYLEELTKNEWINIEEIAVFNINKL